jgi:hypothetical protein
MFSAAISGVWIASRLSKNSALGPARSRPWRRYLVKTFAAQRNNELMFTGNPLLRSSRIRCPVPVAPAYRTVGPSEGGHRSGGCCRAVAPRQAYRVVLQRNNGHPDLYR